MQDVMLSDVRAKLAESRKVCPNLNEEVYAFVDYMCSVSNDKMTPMELAMLLVSCMVNILSDFKGVQQKEQHIYLIQHKTQVLEQAVHISKIIDKIAEKEFAIAFREICKDILWF